MNDKNKKYSVVILLVGLFVIFGLVIVLVGKMKIQPGNVDVIRAVEDSIMLPDRHMGYVNVAKFVELSKKLPNNCFTDDDYSIEKDSIWITVHSRRYFYGMDGGDYWISFYKNIPIRIEDNGFMAEIKDVDSVQYMYIPYQILSTVASHAGNSGIQSAIIHQQDDTPKKANISNSVKESLPEEGSSVGKKIQTEGYVLKNVSDILAQYPNKTKRQQMEILWRYARKNWNYVNDPAVSSDMWRSASETIENYYFVNGRCYTGDCDDFAILMASFARQIGYESRVVVAFNTEGGHAYAEFKDGKNWVNLDWFSEQFGGAPFNGARYRVYDDL